MQLTPLKTQNKLRKFLTNSHYPTTLSTAIKNKPTEIILSGAKWTSDLTGNIGHMSSWCLNAEWNKPEENINVFDRLQLTD